MSEKLTEIENQIKHHEEELEYWKYRQYIEKRKIRREACVDEIAKLDSELCDILSYCDSYESSVDAIEYYLDQYNFTIMGFEKHLESEEVKKRAGIIDELKVLYNKLKAMK